MKKGLAIVLAAATALTFAPVSTLGLQGVVEAQAAATETNDFELATGISTAAGTAASVTITAKNDGVNTITPANLSATVKNSAGVDVTSNFTFSFAAGTDGTASSKATATMNVTPKRTVAAGTYTVTVKTTNGTAITTDDKTADGTVTVTAYAVPNVTGPETGSGLVHNDLDVADGQNYKLVDDTAKFKAAWITGDQEYGADELTWVLVKGATAATSPNNQTNDVPTVTTQTKFDGGSFSGRVLSVTDASKVAATTPSGANKYSLIGYASVGSENRVVYSGVITLTQKNKTYTDNVSASTAAKTFEATGYESKNVISSNAFSGIRFQTSANNNFVKGSDMSSSTVNASVTGDTSYFEIAEDGKNSTAAVETTASDIKSDIDSGDNPLKNFVVRGKAGTVVKKGTYHLAFTVEYTVGSVNLTKVINVTITVGTGPIVTCADGNVVYATTDATKHVAEDPTVYLDLTKNKTYDLASKLTSDTPNTTYSYSLSSSNVSVDEKGIVTAKSVGTAYVTITPKADGVEGNKLTVAFRVNANGFDDLTVVGKDKDTAQVLDTKTYANNNVDSEEQLALRQIKYVQVEVNGDEGTNITETPVVTSANKATLTYSLDKKPAGSNVEVDPSTGKITIPYAQVKANTAAPALGVYTVKVVSTGTATSAQTISYYYFVVDYPDKAIKGINDAYNVGSCSATHSHEVAIGFKGESDTTVTGVKAVNKDTDSFVGGSLYTNDDTKAFEYDTAKGEVYRAYTEGKTMHFLVYNTKAADGSHGNTYKVVTVKSAPAVSNYVTKIVNKTTGKTLYDNTKDSAETAKKLTISKVTTIAVTLAHPVAVSGSAVSLKIGTVDDSDSIINQNIYVTAVKNKNNVDVVLYPNSVGTQVISVGPGGHLTSVDRTDIHKSNVFLAVEYAGKSVEAGKVTGLKVANKKGAAVSVSWKSQGANVLYRVYKKVGSGKWVAKNVAGTKTSLKVKKGAKVTVKVKAYTKSAAGETVWGPKATQVTKKTDKK